MIYDTSKTDAATSHVQDVLCKPNVLNSLTYEMWTCYYCTYSLVNYCPVKKLFLVESSKRPTLTPTQRFLRSCSTSCSILDLYKTQLSQSWNFVFFLELMSTLCIGKVPRIGRFGPTILQDLTSCATTCRLRRE